MDALAWNRIRYTLIAPVYDTVVRMGAHRRRAAELLRLRDGERVLVDGCGTGADLAHLPAGIGPHPRGWWRAPAASPRAWAAPWTRG